jgi:hypothetical protein
MVATVASHIVGPTEGIAVEAASVRYARCCFPELYGELRG